MTAAQLGRPPGWMRILPRRALSRLVGAAARTPLPSCLLRPLLRVYGRIYGVNWGEMARPLEDYGSVTDFFTRQLRPGARLMPEDPGAIACPADGRIAQAQVIEAGTLIQAKGLTYTVDDLLARPGAGEVFAGGTCQVVYLAPGDYHRFHWPFDAQVDRIVHEPGDLWPVNESAVATVPRLFARNERVVVEGRTMHPGRGDRFAFIAVGALNVGSIRLAFHDVRTNRGGPARRHTWAPASSAPWARARRGQELGWFEMGSTVVLLLARSAGHLDSVEAGVRCHVGDRVGQLVPGEHDAP